MPDRQEGRILEEAAQQVLETMFFTSILGPRDTGPEGPLMVTRVHFHGSPSGNLSLRLSASAARSIAANFLGAEDESEVTDAQIGEVAGELANMICGAVLSRVESESIFDIDHPEVVAETEEETEAPSASRYFDLDNGAMGVILRLDRSE